jgi:hypothetical protein
MATPTSLRMIAISSSFGLRDVSHKSRRDFVYSESNQVSLEAVSTNTQG